MATLPTERPVTPLRQRMIDDTAMRAMGSRTQHDYVRHVRVFAAFLGRSPDTVTAEDVRRFQVHQREHGAGDPRYLGARIGITAVLHSWGSAMTHHPHIHMIVPGGGIALDGGRWISSRPAFLLPVRVLGKLFRRLFLTRLAALHDAGRFGFNGRMAHLADRRAFLRHLSPVRKKRWVVYAKPRSPPPRRCSPTCRATRTASPSRTAGSSASTGPASRCAIRIIAAPAPIASRS